MCVQSMDHLCSEYGSCAFRVWIVFVQSMDHVCSEHGSCVFRAWIMCSEHGSCVFRAWFVCDQSRDITPRLKCFEAVSVIHGPELVKQKVRLPCSQKV